MNSQLRRLSVSSYTEHDVQTRLDFVKQALRGDHYPNHHILQ